MSVLNEYPDTINTKDLQIWNNSAFDDGGETESFNSCNNHIKSPSFLAKKPVPVNHLSSDSFDSSFSSKENQSPTGFLNLNLNSNLKLKSSVFVHPLHESKSCNVVDDFEKTDEEIAIENEINRLVKKLESIRLERVQRNAKCVEKQGKLDLEKQGKLDLEKKKESGVKKMIPNKIQRRGFSLGPNEIMSGSTNSNSKTKHSGMTPVQLTQNRRKSCFWKLDDIEEEKCGFSRIKNSNVRQAVTTVGSKKGVKKEDSILGSIQPKRLFGDQSVPGKKIVKPGRVVPSRYNQATVNSSMKKRSSSSLFTDNVERKPRGETEGRVKKKWEIPSAIVVPKRVSLDENDDGDGDVNAVDVVMQEVLLPRIRVGRYVEDSGRESGPAKRVAELVGKKSYFDEEAVCQKLSFDED